MMPACIFRYTFQVLGVGQRFEHLDRHGDMIVDDLTFPVTQCAPANLQVLAFLFVQYIFRPAGNRPPLMTCNPVNFPYCLVRDRFTTDIAGPDKLQICIKPVKFGIQFLVFKPCNSQCSQLAFQCSDLGITFQHFKTPIHQLDTIKNSLQFGGLVYHVFRRGDLATVMQPGRDIQFVFLLFRHAEILKRTIRNPAGRIGNQISQYRHTPAMTGGIR